MAFVVKNSDDDLTEEQEIQYYRVILRPKELFLTFRYRNIGKKSNSIKIIGRTGDGSWKTHAFLVDKNEAVIEKGRLIPKKRELQGVMKKLVAKPKRKRRDVFLAEE